MNAQERVAEITRELQDLDAAFRGQPLPTEVEARFQDLENEREDLEARIGAAAAAEAETW